MEEIFNLQISKKVFNAAFSRLLQIQCDGEHGTNQDLVDFAEKAYNSSKKVDFSAIPGCQKIMSAVCTEIFKDSPNEVLEYIGSITSHLNNKESVALVNDLNNALQPVTKKKIKP